MEEKVSRNDFSDSINTERNTYQKIGLYKKPNKKLLNFLDLQHDEEVLINLSLFPFKNLFINDVKERFAKHLILTTQRVIFILNRGYLIKEFFTYNQITSIVVTSKWHISGDFPVIILKTATDVYELVFSTLFTYRKKISGIVDCIKTRNRDIEISIDWKGSSIDYIKEILLTKIKFK
jgi:hypothetical protein